MDNKYSLRYRFISRLEHTRSVSGYISLEAIVNGQLKQKNGLQPIEFKKVYKIADIQWKPSPVPAGFKTIRRKNST